MIQKPKKPILVVMAAGVGSRFGGLKQLAAFGPNQEGLIDYSLFDAARAGFERVVFVVNAAIKEQFRAFIGIHAEKRMRVDYACQELDMLPAGFTTPENRKKPWGTAHAVLCCGDLIDAPFCVVNGDDLYGRAAMAGMYAYLADNPDPYRYAMVGYRLKNTVSVNGYVSRGVCEVDGQGHLTRVTERTHIVTCSDGQLFTEDGKIYHKLPEDTIVSMNMWGFTPDFIHELQVRFPRFLTNTLAESPEKKEFFLPAVVEELLAEGNTKVRVMTTEDDWFGVTNPSDAPAVRDAIARMIKNSVYPENLWS